MTTTSYSLLLVITHTGKVIRLKIKVFQHTDPLRCSKLFTFPVGLTIHWPNFQWNISCCQECSRFPFRQRTLWNLWEESRKHFDLQIDHFRAWLDREGIRDELALRTRGTTQKRSGYTLIDFDCCWHGNSENWHRLSSRNAQYFDRLSAGRCKHRMCSEGVKVCGWGYCSTGNVLKMFF